MRVVGINPPPLTSDHPSPKRRGAVAQLGEHLLCKEGVRSSSLLGSTSSRRLQRERREEYTAGTREKQEYRAYTKRMRNPIRAIE